MKRSKRVLSFILALGLMLSLLPFGASAHEERLTTRFRSVNPVYAGILDESDLPQPTRLRSAGKRSAVHTTLEDAAADVREQLKNRAETVSFSVMSDEINDNIYSEIFDLAVAHTGVPTEGDYLLWQIGGILDGNGSRTDYDDGSCLYQYQIQFFYYTTHEQELELDARVSQALAEMQLEGMSREQKIRTIYDYVCRHVAYDNDHESDYMLQYTAYAALVNGTAVCQGYSVLLYRLLLEAGIDCRFIGGESDGVGHAWNIVKLGGTYYCEDSTWDSIMPEHIYELRGLDHFPSHTPDAEYADESFTAAYPTSFSDYNAGSAADQDGLTYIAAEGFAVVTECDVFLTGAKEIPPALGGAPVTEIGFRAFDRCTGLTAVSIPATVAAVDDYAFSGCAGLTDVWFGGTEAEWNAIAIGSHNEPLQQATIHYSEPAACQHSETAMSGVIDPTCTESGYTGDLVCVVCGEIVAVGETIPALGHVWDDGVVTQEPTAAAEGVKTFTCTVCGEKRTESIAKLVNPFKDVNESRFFFDAVLWAVSQEPQITSGYSDNTFRPDQTCTRAHVVTFLWRAKGCPEPESLVSPFKDVANTGIYYYKAVLWAAEQGITTGYSDGTFRPNDECIRSQIVTFLWRANSSPDPENTNNPFTDVPNGKFYTKAVLWAVENGVTTGYSDGTFRPDNECTRGQVVTFLYRASN